MAFVVPIIATAAGLGAFGTAVLQAAVGIGLSFAAKKLTGKRRDQGTTGVNVSLRVATDAPRDVIFGEAFTGGQLVYWHVYGPGNKYLHLVIALASHRIEGISEIRVNNEPVTWNSSTGAVTEYPGDLMKIKLYDGSQTTADADLVANSGGRWTSSEVGRETAYVAVTLRYDQAKFPQGIPSFGFRVKGAKLYDPRLDSTAGGSGAQRWADPATWAYSDNPAVISYNVLRGFDGGTGAKLVGMNAPASAIRAADYIAAANACDETVGTAGGSTEKRFRCGFLASADVNSRAILDAAMSAMAGQIVSTGGIYRIQAGVAQSAVAHLTDDDIIVDEPFITSPKVSRADVVNIVTGGYAAPELGGAMRPLPARTSPSDQAADGGVPATIDLDLASVFSRPQAQRVMEIARRKGRRTFTAQVAVRSRWSVLEAGDWITFTSVRRGFNVVTFEVVDRSRRTDHITQLTLRETDGSIDDWTAGDEIEDGEIVAAPPAGPVTAEIDGVTVETLTVLSGGSSSRPGLRVLWTPPGDPTYSRVVIEYRKAGDAIALERIALDPEAGQYTWVDGVQGGTIYEARARAVTVPERAFSWSAWASTASDTAAQTVEVASTALTVPPGSIGPTELDVQSKFEIGLTTATEEITGSLSAQVARIVADMRAGNIATMRSLALGTSNRAKISVERTERLTAQEALAQQITTALAQIDETQSSVTQEITARAQADSALAQSITSLTTTVNGQAVTVSLLAASIDGVEGRIGLAVNANNQVVGLALLEGTALGSAFTVVADKFQVAQPGVNGGAVVPVFTIANVAGVPKLVFRGDMFGDGQITARALNVATLSALSADLGNVVAGLWSSQDGKMLIDGRAGQPKRLRIVS